MKPSLFARIGNIFGDIGRAHAATREYERLSAMSDARLAAHGLRRAELVSAAFEAAFGKNGRG